MISVDRLPVLVATDLPEPGPAPASAAGRQASGVLVDRAAARAAAMAPGTPVIVTVTPGAAAGTLVELSRDAWTVVVGCRGDGTRADAELGSVSHQVTARAACPVVVVPEASTSRPDGPGVVVGVDGSQPSHEAVGFAVEHAARRGVPLTAVHASPGRVADEAVPGTEKAAEQAALLAAQQRLVDASLDGWPEKYPDVAVRAAPGLGQQGSGPARHLPGRRRPRPGHWGVTATRTCRS